MLDTLHYYYVYFNSCYLKRGLVSQDEYNSICLRDLDKEPFVDVISTPLQQYPYFLRRLYSIHTSKRLNKIIRIPFQKLWYPFFFKGNFKNTKPYCFVIADTNLPIDYLFYLKNKFPRSKFIKLHRDLLKVTYSNNPEYSEENMNKIFDLRFSYDENESRKFNLIHFDEIGSKIDVPIDKNYPISDVFFAGKVKDRLQKILSAYHVFKSAGLKCDFYLVGAKPQDCLLLEGITYSDNFMPYTEMLYRSINSRCLLDINQAGANGYTSRILEAIMYNKRIISDNPYILNSKYFNPDYVQFVKCIDEIDTEFIKKNNNVDFEYEGDFSPIHLIKRIDEELTKRYS